MSEGEKPKRRRSSMTPTARTLNYLRSQGVMCQRADHYNTFARKSFDLFGFIDVVALDVERKQIIGIQVTSGASVSTRIRKIKEEEDILEAALNWLRCGGAVQVWGWRKVKAKRGGKAMVWEPRVVELSEDDLL